MSEFVIDSKKFGDVSDTGDFVGDYMRRMKEASLIACISDVHLLIVGAKGTGKTSMTMSLLKKAFNGKTKFQRFSPSTEPETITGIPSLKSLYDDAMYVYNPKGTVSDAEHRAMQLDELQRLNDAGLELMMQRLDRNDMPLDYDPVAIACVNWIPKGDRLAALVDRFAMEYYVPKIDGLKYEIARAIVKALNNGRERTKDPGAGIPDEETIDAVRNTHLSDRAEEAVAKFVGDFAEIASKGLIGSDGNVIQVFEPSNRRIEQWVKIVARMSVYYSGNGDFSEVPREAKSSLRYGWVSQSDPSESPEMEHWRQFVEAGSIDPLDSILTTLMEQAVIKMNEIYDANATDGSKLSREFGQFIRVKSNQFIDALRDAGVENPEVDERFRVAFEQLNAAFKNVVDGKRPV